MRYLPWRYAIIHLLAVPLVAGACQPALVENASFIHANVAQLPANAKGALFLAPTRTLTYLGDRGNGRFYSGTAPDIGPHHFRILGSDSAKPLPVQLTKLNVLREPTGRATWRAYRFVSTPVQEQTFPEMKAADVAPLLARGILQDITAEVRAAEGNLLRVGPPGGFKAGVHYAITYTGPYAGQAWRYPDYVSHRISVEEAPSGGAYTLARDGTLTRRLFVAPDGFSCEDNRQPALVQDFHYVAPAGVLPWSAAILYFSHVESGNAGFRPSWSSLVTSPYWGAVSQGAGREVAYWPCEAASGKVNVRGSAGILEVDDSLTETAPLEVNLAGGEGASCTALARQVRLSARPTHCASMRDRARSITDAGPAAAAGPHGTAGSAGLREGGPGKLGNCRAEKARGPAGRDPGPVQRRFTQRRSR